MKMKSFLTFALVLFAIGFASAQDDLMNELNATKAGDKQLELAAFKGLQICNMQSTKLPVKGEIYFVVSHRFTDLTPGINNFFGLDGTAYTKIGGIYGVTNWLSLGASRHTPSKIYELSSKIKFADQETNGFPFTIVEMNSMDINSKLTTVDYPLLKTSNRLAFTTQLAVSRKFSDSFSFELNPIYVHKNLYDPETERKDQFLMGVGGRYKLSKRISLNADWAARAGASDHDYYVNPLSLGIDIETGGHVFQMVFSNTQQMNDVSYFTNAVGRSNGGGIFFGFNMYRVF
jgi:hypothetical protein